ncbi:hypothetical protein DPMN_164257 [Dreissena polymorpha]|uniref:YqaJ viral recombinase domain-containing protein n=1 Tax=Dreissena polymorpha TaxID=45954 RepID=A0A9D4IV87_DREPO|nr:hypothetical protein DPMN_164257 [Dreissena polymorpha]
MHQQVSNLGCTKRETVAEFCKSKRCHIEKSHYLKSPTDRQAEVVARKMKQAFTPLTKKQSEDVKDGAKMRLDLHTLLAPDIPDSCFGLTMEGRRHKNKSIELPKTIIELSKETLTSDELILKLTLTDTEIENLKIATVNQSESLIWHSQRRGRITASIFKRVCTRVDTIRKDKTTDVTKLKEAILGEKPLIQTKAMKHGIAMEPAAKREYITTQKKNTQEVQGH